MIPKSYRKQNSCHNCKHSLILQEYCEQDRFFCYRDKCKISPFVSVVHSEIFYEDEEVHSQESFDLWIEWSGNHEIFNGDVCDEWEKCE